MNRKEILKRLEELEEIAHKNIEKYDETPIQLFLSEEEADEYNKLLKDLREVEVKK
jgi:hypothetical protein